MKTEYQYIHFHSIPFIGKTLKFECENNKTGAVLGEMKWHPGWRR